MVSQDRLEERQTTLTQLGDQFESLAIDVHNIPATDY
jgi:hypothetical protein